MRETSQLEDKTVSRTGIFGGTEIRYSAALETIVVPATEKTPGAELKAFSYIANGTDKAERPVLFVFNGGPISASLWLHIGAMGPVRVAAPDDLSAPLADYHLVHNDHSPLDVADIVFFDPASTGLSRVAEGGDPSAYFSVAADAQQFVAFTQAWLSQHGREGARVFVLGESYGTMRASEAAGQFAEEGRVNLEGVFLMGQAANIIEYSQRRQNIISYVVSLPTLASIAWDLGKADKADRSFEQFLAEVETFGEQDYLVALFKGQRIAPSELAAISERLEAYTGIPASYYVENRLRISKEQFRVELLKDEAKILGRSDGRYVGPSAQGGDPSGVLQQAYSSLFAAYAENTFGITQQEDYREVLSSGGYDQWDWGASSPFGHFAYADRLNEAFVKNPQFRLLIGNGYHDTMTTVGAADYLLDQSDWPRDRVRTSYYAGGHMAYSVESSAAAFGDDIRDWIRGWPAADSAETETE